MNHLVSVRHGSYAINGRLTSDGREQMRRLANSIGDRSPGVAFRLVSSDAPRSLDSSEILASRLGITDIEREPYLWSADDGPADSYLRIGDDTRLLRIVTSRERGSEGLIVVGHTGSGGQYGSAEQLATLYAELKGVERFVRSLDHGRAAHVNLLERSLTVIPPRS